jgi:hypothetical protein
MAEGSQKWNGTSADLVIAPTSTHTTPAVIAAGVAAGPVKYATNAESRVVCAAWASTTSPTSIVSPPAAVTTSAWTAAARLARLCASWPTSRNEKTVVSSQHT